MPRYAARRLRRAHCPGPSLHVALARPPADAARGGGALDWRGQLAPTRRSSISPASCCLRCRQRPAPERLVHIWMGGGSNVSHRQWRALEESRALEGLTGFNIETTVNWRGPDQTLNLITMAVEGNFFDVVGVPMALGRGFTAARGAGGAATRRWSSSATDSGRSAWVADPAVHRQHAHVQRQGLHGDSVSSRRARDRSPGSGLRLKSTFPSVGR